MKQEEAVEAVSVRMAEVEAIDAGAGTGYDELAALLGDRMGRPIGVYLSTPPSMLPSIRLSPNRLQRRCLRRRQS